MKGGVALTLAVLIGTPAASAELFRCKPLDQVTLSDEGMLIRYDQPDTLDRFNIDILSGIVKVIDPQTEVWFETELVIVQKASEVNDFIATNLPRYGDKDVALGMTVGEVVNEAMLVGAEYSLRIRTWKGSPITYVQHFLGVSRSGICERAN
jgi:hypothetical protein